MLNQQWIKLHDIMMFLVVKNKLKARDPTGAEQESKKDSRYRESHFRAQQKTEKKTSLYTTQLQPMQEF